MLLCSNCVHAHFLYVTCCVIFIQEVKVLGQLDSRMNGEKIQVGDRSRKLMSVVCKVFLGKEKIKKRCVCVCVCVCVMLGVYVCSSLSLSLSLSVCLSVSN